MIFPHESLILHMINFSHDSLIFTLLNFHLTPPTDSFFPPKWLFSFQMCFSPHMILFFFHMKIFQWNFRAWHFEIHLTYLKPKWKNIILLSSREPYKTAIRVNTTSSIKSKIKISGRADDVVGIFKKTIFIGSPKETVFPQNGSKLRPFTPQAKQTRCTACKNSETFKRLPEGFLFSHILFCLCRKKMC